MPMFPLGTVLFPTMLLPLHVFEPRYRALVDDCVAGDGEFGVTLIERGSEVGGGDVRTDVGTVARIVQVERFEDGRFAVAAVGTRRIRIERWLADDPYPRAEVVDWEDVGRTETALDDADALFRRALALAAELGEAPAPLDVELADDPAMATFQIGALAPLGPLDRQALLATERPDDRVTLLVAQLTDVVELLRARLGR
ncbi:MAG TPA: LON peptidase substrate-binding domain-containing protein [Acidimicrobiales bacterium]|nr:LON peptidase substrate-binding domain-containing protein [Acidimicrobiales bacterium]